MARAFRLTGAGAVLAGGRWGVKGIMPAVYASTDPATLAAELNYKGLRYGWTQADFHAQLRVGMRWELQAVVDLTAGPTLRALRVTRATIIGVDWLADQTAGREPVTQAVARAAFENMAEGLVVPSARQPGGVNVVLFPCHRRDGTVLTTLNAGQLPPDMHGL
jgi:RES domain-containing protein